MSLTRADLESSRLHQMLSQAGIDLPLLGEAELHASIQRILVRQKTNTDVWIFAYGSLIWNPVFHFVEQQVGSIFGWHRRFCLWTPLGRGTPDNPGLVLGLDRGGSCRGVAFRIAAAQVFPELVLLWRREMVVGSYVPRWVTIRTHSHVFEAIAFTIDRQHPLYSGPLPLETTVQTLATACGLLGSCADYLHRTVEGLASVGVRDPSLLRLQQQVFAMQQQTGRVSCPR